MGQSTLNWIITIINNTAITLDDNIAMQIAEAWCGEPHRFWSLQQHLLDDYNNDFKELEYQNDSETDSKSENQSETEQSSLESETDDSDSNIDADDINLDINLMLKDVENNNKTNLPKANHRNQMKKDLEESDE
ncbi:MAG: hypothetical protein EZS28_026147 [Streblomastix strix]|uniref:Uncharacterized protein n=1 Tax=Streblomastix strix TaxID=222440 RepID=A0A5J4V7X2_9EUKA|nr:MAG: hypothetical protein EZS28_026147 [Streblomastix strix]